MTDRTLVHDSFTLEREYPVPPAAVFRAFADPAIKQRWFGADDDGWTPVSRGMDFRVGGAEHDEGRSDSGYVSRFDAVYHEIVEDVRIVYTYDMRVDGVHLSVSLASIELTPTATGTLLTLTEQGVYFDAHEDPALRAEGTRQILESLGRVLAAAA